MAINYIRWSSNGSFVLVALGATLGLGNFYHVPYLMAQYGGTTIVLLYTIAKLLLALPLIMAEMLAARRTRSTPQQAISILATQSRLSQRFNWAGRLFLFSALAFVSYYLVVTTWSLFYAQQLLFSVKTFSGELAQFQFALMLVDVQPLIWVLLTLLLSLLVLLLLGITRGVQVFAKFTVPINICLLIALLLIVTRDPHFSTSLSSFLQWNQTAVNKQVLFALLQHAFLSTGLGVGAVFAYAMFMPKPMSIGRSGSLIIIVDLVFGFLIAMLVWYFVYDSQLVIDSGLHLIYVAMLDAVSQRAFGHWVAGLLFLVFSLSAITSILFVLLSVVVSIRAQWFIRYRYSVLIVIAFSALSSSACLMSFNSLSEHLFYGMTLFELISNLSSQILLPLTAFSFSLYVGWILSSDIVLDEINPSYGLFYFLWRFIVKFGLTCFLGLLFALAAERWFGFSLTMQFSLAVLAMFGFVYLQWFRQSLSKDLYD